MTMGNTLSCVSCRGEEPARKPSYRTEVLMAPDATPQEGRGAAVATTREDGVVADTECAESGSGAIAVGQGDPDVTSEDAAADIEGVVIDALSDNQKTAKQDTAPEVGNAIDEKRAASGSTEKTSDDTVTGPDTGGRTARAKQKVKATVSWGDGEPEPETEPEIEPTDDVTSAMVTDPRAGTQTEQVREVRWWTAMSRDIIITS